MIQPLPRKSPPLWRPASGVSQQSSTAEEKVTADTTRPSTAERLKRNVPAPPTEQPLVYVKICIDGVAGWYKQHEGGDWRCGDRYLLRVGEDGNWEVANLAEGCVIKSGTGGEIDPWDIPRETWEGTNYANITLAENPPFYIAAVHGEDEVKHQPMAPPPAAPTTYPHPISPTAEKSYADYRKAMYLVRYAPVTYSERLEVSTSRTALKSHPVNVQVGCSVAATNIDFVNKVVVGPEIPRRVVRPGRRGVWRPPVQDDDPRVTRMSAVR